MSLKSTIPEPNTPTQITVNNEANGGDSAKVCSEIFDVPKPPFFNPGLVTPMGSTDAGFHIDNDLLRLIEGFVIPGVEPGVIHRVLEEVSIGSVPLFNEIPGEYSIA